MLEQLLDKYDLFHSSIICGGKVKTTINYLLDGKIYISLTALYNGEELKDSFDFKDDEHFRIYVLPKIFQRFYSKNIGVQSRKIMGNETRGTLIIEKKDLTDSLIIRNCSTEVMELADALLDSLNEVSNLKNVQESRIIFNSNSNDRYDTYIRTNIVFDYAYYRTYYFKIFGKDKVPKIDEEDEDSLQLLILNIARYACTFDASSKLDLWGEITSSFSNNKKVTDICEEFRKNTFKEKTIYSVALVLAEYEKNNDIFLHSSEVAVTEALEACDNVVNFFNNSYLTYWETRRKYYASVLDGQREAICLDFLSAHDLGETKAVGMKNKINIDFNKIKNDKELINKFKNIKKQKLSFSEIIQGNGEADVEEAPATIEDEVEKIFFDVDKEKMEKDAMEQAKDIIKIEQERDQLRRDAEEFAKIILKTERDHKKIISAAEEQARKIIELKKENEELKMLAQDNAKYIFEKQMASTNVEMVKEAVDDNVEVINRLLDDLKEVQNMRFVVNRPTVLQGIMFLQEKIINYLSGHENEKEETEHIVSIEKSNPLEVKPVDRVLALIKNTYVSSHYYEKDGKYTLIDFSPVDEDTYRSTLYSVKDSKEEMLMDAYFEEYQLTDKVLKDICDIFSTNAVIVASKVSNRANDRQDYVVIDSKNNTIRFNNFRKDFIARIRENI